MFPFHFVLVSLCDSHGGVFQPGLTSIKMDKAISCAVQFGVAEKPSGFSKFCGMDDYLNHMENPFRK